MVESVEDIVGQAGQQVDQEPRPQVVQPDHLQGHHLNMAVFLSTLTINYLPSVRGCSSIHWTSHFLQGTGKTRPCLSGQVVARIKS